MLAPTFVRTAVMARLRRGPLGPYLDDFATTLHHQGYAPSSIQLYLRTAEHYAQWLQGQGHGVSDMDGDLVQRYVSGLTRYQSGKLPKAAQGLSHLVRFLQQQGVVRPRPVEISPIEQWLVDYDAYLEQVAGLALSTRQGYRRIVRRFIAACCGAETPDWSSVLASRITAFVIQESAWRQRSSRQLPAVAVRSFLRFLVFRGVIRPGLEAAAPAPPQWRHASLPSRLTPEEVERVLAVYHDDTASSLRNRAMLLLLARLGLRTQDVISLRLDDIDWADGRLDLRPGKARRARSVPLPHDVGQAMVAYVQGGRPPSASRQVFLRCRPPFQPLTKSAVWWMARQAFTNAGLAVPPGIASHIFRHTAASQMVNQGVSFKDVADVLGHQSIRTTGIYAKLDLNALAAVALPWGGGAR
ncbi:MAG TPA: tyrosine-type recombinase/integrase [Candidatus Tectomicrobia bacterium]